jgi:hypothetical protein
MKFREIPWELTKHIKALCGKHPTILKVIADGTKLPLYYGVNMPARSVERECLFSIYRKYIAEIVSVKR